MDFFVKHLQKFVDFTLNCKIYIQMSILVSYQIAQNLRIAHDLRIITALGTSKYYYSMT